MTEQPRIVNVEYTPGQTFNAIKTVSPAFAIVTWSNGCKTIVYGDDARAANRQWQEAAK